MDNVKKMEFRIQLLIFLDIFSFPYKYGDYSSDIWKEIVLESSSVCHCCGSGMSLIGLCAGSLFLSRVIWAIFHWNFLRNEMIMIYNEYELVAFSILNCEKRSKPGTLIMLSIPASPWKCYLPGPATKLPDIMWSHWLLPHKLWWHVVWTFGL